MFVIIVVACYDLISFDVVCFMCVCDSHRVNMGYARLCVFVCVWICCLCLPFLFLSARPTNRATMVDNCVPPLYYNSGRTLTGGFHNVLPIQLELVLAPHHLRVPARPLALLVRLRLLLPRAARARLHALPRLALHDRCVCIMIVCLRARRCARASKTETRFTAL